MQTGRICHGKSAPVCGSRILRGTRQGIRRYSAAKVISGKGGCTSFFDNEMKIPSFIFGFPEPPERIEDIHHRSKPDKTERDDCE
jgi:hypothetical protein